MDEFSLTILLHQLKTDPDSIDLSVVTTALGNKDVPIYERRLAAKAIYDTLLRTPMRTENMYKLEEATFDFMVS